MAIVKEGLFYSKSHEWVEVKGDIARIGITDFAQHELGELVYAEAVPTGRTVRAGQAIGAVESVKTASDLITPVSGEVVESNSQLGEHPENINTNPFDNWFVALRLTDHTELAGLMDASSYEAFCGTER